MAGSIEIGYQAATFTANAMTITVGGGGVFELCNDDFLSISGTFSFGTLAISSRSISFYNSSTGGTANGAITVPVASNGGVAPTIIVTNFQGTVTISWPSEDGPQYQQMYSGDPITLTGLIG